MVTRPKQADVQTVNIKIDWQVAAAQTGGTIQRNQMKKRNQRIATLKTG
jgi:hypothetical protein